MEKVNNWKRNKDECAGHKIKATILVSGAGMVRSLD
jgi:hypothetical protein